MMDDWERIVTAIGPVRIIVALGVLFVAVGATQAGFLVANARHVEGAVLDFALLGGPGFVLLYGGQWLPHTGIDPEIYPRIVLWVFGGLGVMLVAVGFLMVNPGGEITRPLLATVMASGFGAIGGFPIGVNEARAITRAREAERRNREIEQTQAKLSEAVDQLEESNERLEQFAYAVSHDLQEPLRMVSSYLQLLEQRFGDELDDDGREFLAFAVDGADRMREMIEGLLAYSRVETEGEPLEPVDLEAVLDDVRDDLQIKITEGDATITADPLPRVAGDRSQLRQVFQNLLGNAIEYSGDDPPQVHVSADRNDSEWTISISDEGIGIDPDDADRIFEVFQRLHTRDEHAGTGIGLALCKRIVERHGGEIWVESSLDDGSTFYFTLPRTDGNHDRHSPSKPASVG